MHAARKPAAGKENVGCQLSVGAAGADKALLLTSNTEDYSLGFTMGDHTSVLDIVVVVVN
jgi:hypothetical protein